MELCEFDGSQSQQRVSTSAKRRASSSSNNFFESKSFCKKRLDPNKQHSPWTIWKIWAKDVKELFENQEKYDNNFYGSMAIASKMFKELEDLEPNFSVKEDIFDLLEVTSDPQFIDDQVRLKTSEVKCSGNQDSLCVEIILLDDIADVVGNVVKSGDILLVFGGRKMISCNSTRQIEINRTHESPATIIIFNSNEDVDVSNRSNFSLFPYRSINIFLTRHTGKYDGKSCLIKAIPKFIVKNSHTNAASISNVRRNSTNNRNFTQCEYLAIEGHSDGIGQRSENNAQIETLNSSSRDIPISTTPSINPPAPVDSGVNQNVNNGCNHEESEKLVELVSQAIASHEEIQSENPASASFMESQHIECENPVRVPVPLFLETQHIECENPASASFMESQHIECENPASASFMESQHIECENPASASFMESQHIECENPASASFMESQHIECENPVRVPVPLFLETQHIECENPVRVPLFLETQHIECDTESQSIS